MDKKCNWCSKPTNATMSVNWTDTIHPICPRCLLDLLQDDLLLACDDERNYECARCVTYPSTNVYYYNGNIGHVDAHSA